MTGGDIPADTRSFASLPPPEPSSPSSPSIFPCRSQSTAIYEFRQASSSTSHNDPMALVKPAVWKELTTKVDPGHPGYPISERPAPLLTRLPLELANKVPRKLGCVCLLGTMNPATPIERTLYLCCNRIELEFPHPNLRLIFLRRLVIAWYRSNLVIHLTGWSIWSLTCFLLFF